MGYLVLRTSGDFFIFWPFLFGPLGDYFLFFGVS